MLDARSPLDGYHMTKGGTSLDEVADLRITSAAGQNTPECWPAIGAADRNDATADNAANAGRTLRLAVDQVLVIGEYRPQAHPGCVITDQSDGWAALRLEGTLARAALERVCMLDLHPEHFRIGHVARTVMEHLGVILLREGEDRYLLLSARSSAASFAQAIATSLNNVALRED